MLCILLDILLHICYKGIIFASEIKQNTNSTDPRRSLKSATKTMKILSAYKKEEWTADEIRENITALFGNDEIGNDYANNLIEMLAQTDDTECVIEAENGELHIVKRADIYDDNGIAEIAEEDLHF